jgi:hypothetical protein
MSAPRWNHTIIIKGYSQAAEKILKEVMRHG